MRDRLLDTAKGLGIILVIWGHLHYGSSAYVISLFHMPLFFFLSGAALLYSKSNGISFKKKVKTLLIPYWIFSLFFFLYWWFIGSVYFPIEPTRIFAQILGGKIGVLPYFIQRLIQLFYLMVMGWTIEYDEPLWFLPCMFAAIVSYIGIRNIFGKYAPIIYAICAGIYFTVPNHIPHLPFSMEISITTLPLIWIGENTYGKLRDINVKKGVILASSTLLLSAILIRTTYYTHRYAQPPIWNMVAVLSYIYTINYNIHPFLPYVYSAEI